LYYFWRFLAFLCHSFFYFLNDEKNANKYQQKSIFPLCSRFKNPKNEIRALCCEPFFSLFLYAKVNWEIENGHFKMSIFDLLKILCPKHFL